MSAFSLADHAALVTGSSQGIGLAIARGIHAAGGRVVLHGKTGPAPPSPRPPPFSPRICSSRRVPPACVAAAFRAEPALDLLVCNAGSFFDRPFLEMTPELLDRTYNLNVRANYFRRPGLRPRTHRPPPARASW
jgi:NAD(P)-dependent dehydrogenase (short-subunit alcohol dehydrogenase family)